MIRKHQKIIITKTFTRGRYKNWRISLVLSLLLLWHEKCGRHAMMISGGSRGAPVTETFLTRWSVWPSLGFCMLATDQGGPTGPAGRLPDTLHQRCEGPAGRRGPGNYIQYSIMRMRAGLESHGVYYRCVWSVLMILISHQISWLLLPYPHAEYLIRSRRRSSIERTPPASDYTTDSTGTSPENYYHFIWCQQFSRTSFLIQSNIAKSFFSSEVWT